MFLFLFFVPNLYALEESDGSSFGEDDLIDLIDKTDEANSFVNSLFNFTTYCGYSPYSSAELSHLSVQGKCGQKEFLEMMEKGYQKIKNNPHYTKEEKNSLKREISYQKIGLEKSKRKELFSDNHRVLLELKYILEKLNSLEESKSLEGRKRTLKKRLMKMPYPNSFKEILYREIDWDRIGESQVGTKLLFKEPLKQNKKVKAALKSFVLNRQRMLQDLWKAPDFLLKEADRELFKEQISDEIINFESIEDMADYVANHLPPKKYLKAASSEKVHEVHKETKILDIGTEIGISGKIGTVSASASDILKGGRKRSETYETFVYTNEHDEYPLDSKGCFNNEIGTEVYARCEITFSSDIHHSNTFTLKGGTDASFSTFGVEASVKNLSTMSKSIEKGHLGEIIKGSNVFRVPYKINKKRPCLKDIQKFCNNIWPKTKVRRNCGGEQRIIDYLKDYESTIVGKLILKDSAFECPGSGRKGDAFCRQKFYRKKYNWERARCTFVQKNGKYECSRRLQEGTDCCVKNDGSTLKNCQKNLSAFGVQIRKCDLGLECRYDRNYKNAIGITYDAHVGKCQ